MLSSQTLPAWWPHYAALKLPEQAVYLQTYPERCSRAVAESALALARDMKYTQVRRLNPDPAHVRTFMSLVQGAYSLAAELKQHALCAEAAGLLTTIGRRYCEPNDKERWAIAQAIHSALAYPEPKFSSTFDIVVSTTWYVMAQPESAEDATLNFFEQVSAQLVQLVGGQAVDECVKFLSIPHDVYSVTVSLIYLGILHWHGQAATRARPAITGLESGQRASPLVSAARQFALYVIEAGPPERSGAADFERNVNAATRAILHLWRQETL